MKTLSLRGHDNAAAQVHFGDEVTVSIALRGDRVGQFFDCLNRSLNCNCDAPPWLFELCDMVEVAAKGSSVPT